MLVVEDSTFQQFKSAFHLYDNNAPFPRRTARSEIMSTFGNVADAWRWRLKERTASFAGKDPAKQLRLPR